MNNCRILIITSEFPPGPGGIGSHAYSLLNALSDRGFRVDVAAVTSYVPRDQAWEFDRADGSRTGVVRFFNEGRFYLLRRIWKLRSMVGQNHYDVVFLSGMFSLWAGMLLKLIYPRLNTLAILHGSEVNPGPRFIRWVTHHAIARVNCILPVSKFTFDLLPKTLRQKSYRIIPNGIEPLKMPQTTTPKMEFIFGSPALLTVGNVTPRKGQLRVIKALPELLKSFPKLQYHVVGLPTHAASFGETARQLNVQHHVHFHGRLPHRFDLGRVYSSSSVFVILSENQANGDVEGFGIVVLEANFYGIPVIGARGCGIEAAIQDGFNGRLVDGDQPNEVKDALVDILSNYPLYQQKAREWAALHDWSMVSQSFEEIIQLTVSK